jgi:DDE family transposase
MANSATRALRSTQTTSGRPILRLQQTRRFTQELFGADEHAARVLSVSNGVAGILHGATAAIHGIGQAYAELAEISPKSGVKQVDRLLSNPQFSLDRLMPSWVQFVVSVRDEAVIALDWTEYDDDDQATLSAYLVTRHGRATPLCWCTVKKSELRGNRTATEHAMVRQLDELLPPATRVTLLADRGFGDQALYALLQELDWQFVIRFRGVIRVEMEDGDVRAAHAFIGPSGRARMLKNVRVTEDRAPLAAVVVTQAKNMKEPWILATSLSDRKAMEVVKLYGRRFTIEESFRDAKDIHFGMGLKATHIKNPARRDRLLLLIAIAVALLTLLGAAAEAAGLDRYLKVNTVKRRTHSLFRQGHYWYHYLPGMRDEWLVPLMREYDRLVREHAFCCEAFGIL